MWGKEEIARKLERAGEEMARNEARKSTYPVRYVKVEFKENQFLWR